MIGATVIPLPASGWICWPTVGGTNASVLSLTRTAFAASTFPSAPITSSGLPSRPPSTTTSASQRISPWRVSWELRVYVMPNRSSGRATVVRICASPYSATCRLEKLGSSGVRAKVTPLPALVTSTGVPLGVRASLKSFVVAATT